MMLIYEVTADVAKELAADFERYMLGQHIPDVLATAKLTAAFFVNNGDAYRIGYHCDSYDDLDAYLANDAPRLRAHFAAQFPDGVEVSRQVWDIVALFPSPE